MNYSDLLKVTSAIHQCYALPAWHTNLKPRLSPPTVDIPLDIGMMDAGAVIVSMVSLRKMHDFLANSKKQKDDLIASDFGVAKVALLGHHVREDINKSIAHITTVDETDSERNFWPIYEQTHPIFIDVLDQLFAHFKRDGPAITEIKLVKEHISALYLMLEQAVNSN